MLAKLTSTKKSESTLGWRTAVDVGESVGDRGLGGTVLRLLEALHFDPHDLAKSQSVNIKQKAHEHTK